MAIDVLSGIDGSNPLGFLAALGALTATGGTLRWGKTPHGWTPIIERDSDLPIVEDITSALGIRKHDTPPKPKPGRPALETLQLVNDMPAAYVLGEPPSADISGKETVDEDNNEPRVKGRNTKKEFVIVASCETLREARRNADPEDVERLAAHAALTLSTPKAPGPRPTLVRLVMVSGQVRYLRTLRKIVELATVESIENALFGEWQYTLTGAKTAMDPFTDIENIGADLSKLGAISVLGAERLAVEGFRSLPTAASGSGLRTRGFSTRSVPGRQRQNRFRWVLWDAPLPLASIRLWLGAQALHGDDHTAQAWAQGVGMLAIFESAIYGKDKYKRIRRSTLCFERQGDTPLTLNRST